MTSAGEPERRRGAARDATRSRTKSSVVRTLPTSTTNMTGFLATCRGRELAQRCRSSARRTMARIEQRERLRFGTGHGSVHLSAERRRSARRCCPSESAGKNVSAPTMTTTATSSTAKSRAVGREGARARAARSSCRPSSPRWPAPGRSSGSGPPASSRPSVTLYQGVLALSPANAEPLLPAPLVNA